MRFDGTKAYVATDDLKVAVNAAIALERPLLVKGEPGTGKTVLALEIAKAIGAPLLEWHVKSTTKAQQGLYEYDAVSRLRDSQLVTKRSRMCRTTSCADTTSSSNGNLPPLVFFHWPPTNDVRLMFFGTPSLP